MVTCTAHRVPNCDECLAVDACVSRRTGAHVACAIGAYVPARSAILARLLDNARVGYRAMLPAPSLSAIARVVSVHCRIGYAPPTVCTPPRTALFLISACPTLSSACQSAIETLMLANQEAPYWRFASFSTAWRAAAPTGELERAIAWTIPVIGLSQLRECPIHALPILVTWGQVTPPRLGWDIPIGAVAAVGVASVDA